MSSSLKSKCSWWEAGNIGTAVANRAFQHLTKPLFAHLLAAYNTSFENVLEDLTTYSNLSKQGLVSKKNELSVSVFSDERADRFSLNVTKFDMSGELVGVLLGDGLNVSGFDYDLLMEALEAQYTVLKKRSEFVDTVKQQIEGRTYTKIIKAWPELEEIIRATVVIDEAQGSITTPFENLLARFLPALPAPAEA